MTEHISDIAPILTAIGFLINATVALMTYLQSRKNGQGQAKIKEDVAILKVATNGINRALVTATAAASKAEGRAEGIVQGRQDAVDAIQGTTSEEAS